DADLRDDAGRQRLGDGRDRPEGGVAGGGRGRLSCAASWSGSIATRQTVSVRNDRELSEEPCGGIIRGAAPAWYGRGGTWARGRRLGDGRDRPEGGVAGGGRGRLSCAASWSGSIATRQTVSVRNDRVLSEEP